MKIDNSTGALLHFEEPAGQRAFYPGFFNAGSNYVTSIDYTVNNPNPNAMIGAWHHVAVSVDVSNGLALYYVDGRVTSSINVATCRKEGTCYTDGARASVYGGDNWPAPQNSNLGPDQLFGLKAGIFPVTSFRIGLQGGGNRFKGVMDELRIWNYPRTAKDLNQHMFIPATGQEAGLVYYFDFNNGVPSGNNAGVTNLRDAVKGTEAELIGFNLTGSTSNWVRSDINQGNPNVPNILQISPTSSIPGKTVTLYGVNLISDASAYKVTFGSTEAAISSVSTNMIKVVVPSGTPGLNKVRITNSNGSSKSVDFSIISDLSQLPFTWKNQTIYSQIIANNLEKGDINGDGFEDVIVAGATQLVYLQNDGTGKFLNPPPFVIATSTTINYDVHALSDLDRDGDLDIVCTENSTSLTWFRNDGTGSSWTRISILTGQPAMGIKMIDADGDGDTDIIVHGDIVELGNLPGIKLLKNNGLGGFVFDKIIGSGRNFTSYRNSVVVADYNNDGLFDISASTSPSLIVSSLNTPTSVPQFLFQDIGATADYGGDGISAADINNDGWIDMVDIGFQCCFGFRLNQQADPFFIVDPTGSAGRTSTGIGTFKGGPLEPADLNGDGYTDFVLVYDHDNKGNRNINWLRNNNGNGFSHLDISKKNGALLALNAIDAKAVDLDNDGDLDVISASQGDNRVITFFHVFSDKAFSEFSLQEQVVGTTASINSTTHTLDITVNNNANLAKLTPIFTLSLKATAKVGTTPQLSGITLNDFSGSTNSIVYTITAEDGSQQNWMVKVHPLPANPTLNSVTAITNTSATINLTNGTFTDSNLIEISTNNFQTWVAKTSTNLTGLDPGTTYQIRVKGVNAFGKSEGYSNVIVLATLPVAPNLDAVGAITQTTAALGWQNVNGASTYQIDLSADNFSTFVQPYNNYAVAVNNLLLSELVAGTMYQFRVRSANVSGSSPNFSSGSFTTVPPEPLAKQPTLKTSTSFTANWEATPSAAAYIVELSENNFISVLSSINTSLNAVSFTGLTLGKSYVYRIKASNGSGNSGFSNAMPVVLDYSVSITNLSPNESSPANVTAVSSAGIDSVKVFYRGIASGKYTPVNVSLKSGTTFEIILTENMQDEMGIEYYFEVKDGLGDKRQSDLRYNYKKVKDPDKLSVPLTQFGRGAVNYNFFSIPYQLDNAAIGSVFSTLGAYKNTKWRLFHYEDGRYLEHLAGLTDLKPGQGYWFTSLDQANISITNAKVVEANRTKPYTLYLVRGWNQIGNPFSFSISWADILDKNENVTGVGSLFIYKSGGYLEGDLEAWSGGFVSSEGNVSLQIPVEINRGSSGRKRDNTISNKDLSQPEWLLPLTLEQEGNSNHLGGIGMHPNALPGKDEFDRPTLPRFINYLELNSYHSDYFLKNFMQDVVPVASQHNWDFNAESNLESASAVLRWDNESLGSNNAELILYDAFARQFINMKQTSSYPFNLSKKRNLKFFYAIDKEHLTPDADGAGLAFPNPFEVQTIIPFMISEKKTTVLCTIYDLFGRQIKLLPSHHSEAGYNEIQWDGTDNRGQRTSPGVYVYRLSFNGSFSQTKKVILK